MRARARRPQKAQERAALDVATAEALGKLDRAVADLDALRHDVRVAEEAVSALRARVDVQEAGVREARASLDDVRAATGSLEVAHATSEADLSHLATTCVETVQATLDDVVAEVEQLEQAGEATPDSRALESAVPRTTTTSRRAGRCRPSRAGRPSRPSRQRRRFAPSRPKRPSRACEPRSTGSAR